MIFPCGNNQHLSRLDILQSKDITVGISGHYTGTYEEELKDVSHSMPSPCVDSSMDVVISLSWRNANSEYVHRIYKICVESYAKHMILDLQWSSPLNFKISL